jgi:hypothetical protein
MDIEKITAKKINDLHNDLVGIMSRGIEKAVEIGQLLADKKAELKHGEFTPWVKSNLVFTDRTARNYMKLYENREKVLQAGSISDAYKMLGEGKTETVSDMEHSEEVWKSLTRLGEILETMEPGELVTGFTGEAGYNRPNSINIRKIDETYSKYEMVYFPTDDDDGYISYHKRGAQTNFLMQYLAKHADLAFDSIRWVHPGMGIMI